MLHLFDCISPMAFSKIGPATDVLLITEEFCLRFKLLAKICRSLKTWIQMSRGQQTGEQRVLEIHALPWSSSAPTVHKPLAPPILLSLDIKEA